MRQVGNPDTGELFCDADDEEDELEDVKELQGRRAGRLAEAAEAAAEEAAEEAEEEGEIFCFLHWVSTIRQASSSSSSDDIIRGVGGRYKSLNINPLSATSTSPHESALRFNQPTTT